MQRLFLLIALCLLTFLEPSTSDVPPATVDTSINGLVIEKTFVPEACNRRSQEGDGLAMHYTGRIAESSDSGVKGAVFDSSRKRNQPFTFTLGKGEVIKGWDQGLTEMCVGEKRVLTIASELGYGDRGAGKDIPPGATLQFDVELIGINEAQVPPNIFREMDADNDKKITHDEMHRWFTEVRGSKEGIPPRLFEQEDKNEDGSISWEEFGGPKGSSPVDEAPKEEL